jgi:hypothetical protein
MDLMEDTIRIDLVKGYDPTVHKEVEEKFGDSFDYVESRGSSGEIAAWITLSGMAIHNIPQILDFVKFLISRNDVKKLIYTETKNGKKLEIDHPTRDIVETIKNKLKKK